MKISCLKLENKANAYSVLTFYLAKFPKYCILCVDWRTIMGKCAVVTGSSKGMGRAIVSLYAQHGYDVVIHYHQAKDEAYQLQQELIKKYNVRAIVVQADLASEVDIHKFVETVIANFSQIDVLVNNAGIALDNIVEMKQKNDFMKTLEVNTIAPFLLSRAIEPYIVTGGSIIMISSTNGIDTPYPESLDYDVSKAGLISLMHNLATVYAPRIRVNTIAPGWVNTDMNQTLTADFKNQQIHKILMSRFANPIEIANVVYFLSSEAASYINDSVIRVDGGVRKC